MFTMHVSSISHHYLEAVSLKQPLSKKGKWNSHSKDRGGHEEPLSAWAQLTGQ